MTPLLVALGLRLSTELVYRLVLERPEWSVEEIVEHLQWSEAAVRAALDELTDMRLLQMTSDAPGRVRPVSPRLGLSSLLSRTEVELARRQHEIEATRAAVAEFTAHYLPRREYFADVVERLDGIDAVRTRLDELAQVARTECLSMMPGGAQAPDTLDASKPLDQQALERGVTMRTLFQDSVRNSPSTTEYVRWFAALGGETRTVPTLPMLLVIVDRVTVLLPIDPEDVRLGALELRVPGMVAAMVSLFEHLWAVGADWGRAAPLDGHGLAPQELGLLELLTEGCTDQVAADRLGVSLRTVRRMVSDLMARLGATSRFEAGVLAVRRGWV